MFAHASKFDFLLTIILKGLTEGCHIIVYNDQSNTNTAQIKIPSTCVSRIVDCKWVFC